MEQTGARDDEGAPWLGMAELVRATAMHGLHFHHTAASVYGQSAIEDRTSWPSEPRTKPDDAV